MIALHLAKRSNMKGKKMKLLQKKCQLENELSNMKGMNVNISK
jgi:hypothetical protein